MNLHDTTAASSDGHSDPDDLWRDIEIIRIAMVTTRDGSVLRSRPMVASVDRDEEALYFIVNRHDPKIAEIETVPDIALSFVDSNAERYISVSGTAEILVDHAKAKLHGRPETLAWFQRGAEDPDLRLMRVAVSQAEKWDVDSDPVHQAREIAQALGSAHTPELGSNTKFRMSGVRKRHHPERPPNG